MVHRSGHRHRRAEQDLRERRGHRRDARQQEGIKIVPITLTLQYHYHPDGKISPYAGIGGAWIVFDDLNRETSFSEISVGGVNFQNSVGLLLNLGADVKISGPWSINIDGKYVPLDTSTKGIFDSTGTSTADFTVNPLIISAGISYNW